MSVNGNPHGAHPLSCAASQRVRLLALAGDPELAPTSLLHRIAGEIERCCQVRGLRAHRLAWGWTVAQAVAAFHRMCRDEDLGTRGLAERSWLEWESTRRPNDDYRDLLCRLFATSPVKLGFGTDYTPAEIRTDRSAAPPSVAHVVDITTSISPGVSDYGSSLSTGVGDHTDRRQALQSLGSVAAGVGLGSLFVGPTAEAMEYTLRSGATDLGPRTLDQIDRGISDLAVRFPNTSPMALFPVARSYRRLIADFMSGRHTLRQGRELACKAGWLSIVMAWLCNDLGDPVAAEAYCLDAWEHGWQAEHLEICAWSMDASATVAMYSNQPAAAMTAATRGLEVAPNGTAAQVRVGAQLARAQARLGKGHDFELTLRTVGDRLERLPRKDAGLFSADRGRLESYAATSNIWLHRPARAVTHAEGALAFYASADSPAQQSPTREAIARLDLGLALVELGEPDHAVHEASIALDGGRLTASVLARAADVDTALQARNAGLVEAAQFHDHYLALAGNLTQRQLEA